MNRRIAVFSLAVGFATLSSATLASNALASISTTIRGNIYTQSTHLPVVDATVTATCDGTSVGAATTSANTPGFGPSFYAFSDISPSVCHDGAHVVVTAVKGDLSGTAAGNADPSGGQYNVAIVDVPVAQVPEFETITGVAGLLIGAGALYYARSRQTSVN